MLLLTRVAVRAGIWHRGVPNDSPTARPNAVLIYYRKRHQALQKANQKPMQRLMFSESARAAFDVPNPSRVDRNVGFFDGPVNHLRGQTATEEGGAGLGEVPDPSYMGLSDENPNLSRVRGARL